jgi:S-formylglutathione hydrolase FrmB
MLVGFSKSGWGAWSLLLRHPDLFGRAAAWDAPLMMQRLGRYGTRPIFGSRENFERYRLTDLIRRRRDGLRGRTRLILTGYGNFRSEHQRAHALLEQLQIPHRYQDGPWREHHWESGWLAGTVAQLLEREGDAGAAGGHSICPF